MEKSGTINLKNRATLRDAYDRYFGPLCFYGLRYLDNISDVEDIVQDTFIKLSQSGQEFDSDGQLGNYLYRSVYNISLNRLKHMRMRDRHAAVISEQMESMQLTEEELTADIVEDVMTWRLMNAISELPPQCSRVIMLSYIEKRTIAEVAGIMGVSENTVNTQRTRGKKLLRQKLKKTLYLLLLLAT